jgi:hypothetical protein
MLMADNELTKPTWHRVSTSPPELWFPRYVRETLGVSGLTNAEALSLGFSEGFLYFEGDEDA